MLKLQECAAPENLAAYVKDFETEHKESVATHQRAEEFLERFHAPVAEEQPDYPSLAAANAEI